MCVASGCLTTAPGPDGAVRRFPQVSAEMSAPSRIRTYAHGSGGSSSFPSVPAQIARLEVGWSTSGPQTSKRPILEGFSGPQESTAVRLGRPGDVLGHLGVHSRPHVSTAVVSRALAVRLFVPKAERNAHGLCRYRVYRLVTIHWSPPASVQYRVGCHSIRHSDRRRSCAAANPQIPRSGAVRPGLGHRSRACRGRPASRALPAQWPRPGNGDRERRRPRAASAV